MVKTKNSKNVFSFIFVYLRRIETRMDEKIVETASQLFLNRGIKAVSMDDVAQQLGISKRTLYEHFSSKDELVMKCFELQSLKAKESHEAITTEGKDVIEIFVEHLYLVITQLKTVSIAYLQDVSRMCKPDASARIAEEKVRNHELFKEYITKGQENGWFRKDVSVELTLGIFTEQSQTIKELYATGKYTMEDIFLNLFVAYLRGLCTLKGVKRIDEIMEKHSK